MTLGPGRSGALVIAVLAPLSACSGRIAPGPGTDPGGEVSTPGAGDPAKPGVKPVAGVAKFQPGPSGLRRLTRVQYDNAIKDLLGADVTVTNGLDADTVLSGFASIGAALTTFSATATEKLESMALSLAQQALGDPMR